ncbi:hypothetical protein VPDG_00005 [Vibrio phage henriette 12B8]|uniref:HNH endonuclease n=1 Tax=Vibrio phage henriette 12B8 TaxID=573174 RepID=UPI0002C052A2|nr:HNH endonuclease [Vibrio phage henriette 12B8]AGG58167.1 hypothetical protein VPDG_00005 [Vibrio phage henriette 12B8]
MASSNLRRRTKLYGVAVNDADYLTEVSEYIDGRKKTVWICPAYGAWREMIKRCYSRNFQVRCPTYVGCSVCDEWLTFSKFKMWFDKNHTVGYQLDKDLLVHTNKEYSPHACIYVPQSLNILLNCNENARGEYPQGVSYHTSGKYMSRVSINGKQKHLGKFKTVTEASEAYKKAKLEYVTNELIGYVDAGDITQEQSDKILETAKLKLI